MRTAPFALSQLRLRIDSLNDEFVALVARRAALVEEVVEVKRNMGIEIHDPDRERAMRVALVARNPGPLSDDLLDHLLDELFRSCRTHMERVSSRRDAVG